MAANENEPTRLQIHRSLLLNEIQTLLSANEEMLMKLIFGSSISKNEFFFKDSEDFLCLKTLQPILEIVRLQELESRKLIPFLQCIQRLVADWPWDLTKQKSEQAASEFAAEIIESLLECIDNKISQLDEEACTLFIQILSLLIEIRIWHLMSDQTVWQALQILFTMNGMTFVNTQQTKTMQLFIAQCLEKAVTLIFKNPCVFSSENPHGYGLPCAIKIVAYLTNKVRSVAPFDEDTSNAQAQLYYDIVYRIVSVCDAEKFTANAALSRLIEHDLCLALILTCRVSFKDNTLTLTCLKIFRLLWIRMGHTLKIQIHVFWSNVYEHTLVCILKFVRVQCVKTSNLCETALFDDFWRSDPDCLTVIETNDLKSSKLSHFLFKSREVLLHMLDMLADPTILADLFVNYDCDFFYGNKLENTIELLSLLVHECSFVLLYGPTNKDCIFWIKSLLRLCFEGLFFIMEKLYYQSNMYSGGRKQLHPEYHTVDAESEPMILARDLCQRKRLIQQGIEEFNRATLVGFRFMQEHGIFPNDLVPGSIARFLYYTICGLDEKNVGDYLGSRGRDDSLDGIHKAESISFHENVLSCYVELHDFKGETLLDALRIFLSGFRLPGEAQQIDRILYAFAKKAFRQCRDQSFFASVDVVHLLSFSLIMLNTELHNPEIQPHMRTSCAVFVQSNINYKLEKNRDAKLPVDYLQNLYADIATNAIITMDYCDRLMGEISINRWKYLTSQGRANCSPSVFVMHGSSQVFTGNTDAMNDLCALLRKSLSSYCEKFLLDPIEGQDKSISRIPQHVYDDAISERVLKHVTAALVSLFDHMIQYYDTKCAGEISETVPPARTKDDDQMYGEHEQRLACELLVLAASLADLKGMNQYINMLFLRLCKCTYLLPPSDGGLYCILRCKDPMQAYLENDLANLATASVLSLVGRCTENFSVEAWASYFQILCALWKLDAIPACFACALLSGRVYGNRRMCYWVMTKETVMAYMMDSIKLEALNKDSNSLLIVEDDHVTDSALNSARFFRSVAAWILPAKSNLRTEPTAASEVGSMDSQKQIIDSDTTDLLRCCANCPRKNPFSQKSTPEIDQMQDTMEAYTMDQLTKNLIASPNANLRTAMRTLTDNIFADITDKISFQEDPQGTLRACVLSQDLLTRLLLGSLCDTIENHASAGNEDFWNQNSLHEWCEVSESHTKRVFSLSQNALQQGESTEQAVSDLMILSVLKMEMDSMLASLFGLCDCTECIAEPRIDSVIDRRLKLVAYYAIILLDSYEATQNNINGSFCGGSSVVGVEEVIYPKLRILEKLLTQTLRAFRFLVSYSSRKNLVSCQMNFNVALHRLEKVFAAEAGKGKSIDFSPSTIEQEVEV